MSPRPFKRGRSNKPNQVDSPRIPSDADVNRDVGKMMAHASRSPQYIHSSVPKAILRRRIASYRKRRVSGIDFHILATPFGMAAIGTIGVVGLCAGAAYIANRGFDLPPDADTIAAPPGRAIVERVLECDDSEPADLPSRDVGQEPAEIAGMGWEFSADQRAVHDPSGSSAGTRTSTDNGVLVALVSPVLHDTLKSALEPSTAHSYRPRHAYPSPRPRPLISVGLSKPPRDGWVALGAQSEKATTRT